MTDTEIVDWLEKNVGYIMIGADLNQGRPYSEILRQTPEDSGKGWENGILRRAVEQAAKLDAE